MFNADVLTFQKFAMHEALPLEKVSETLQTKNVGEAILETWAEITNQNLQTESDDEDLMF